MIIFIFAVLVPIWNRFALINFLNRCNPFFILSNCLLLLFNVSPLLYFIELFQTWIHTFMFLEEVSAITTQTFQLTFLIFNIRSQNWNKLMINLRQKLLSKSALKLNVLWKYAIVYDFEIYTAVTSFGLFHLETIWFNFVHYIFR